MLNNKDAIKISVLVDEFVVKNDLSETLIYENIRKNWSKITSKTLAKNVMVLRLNNGTLYLKTEVSTWRTEVSLLKNEITELVNNFIGEEVVKYVEIH